MKHKLTRINCFYFIAATITKQMIHDFNLKSKDIRSIKKQSFAAPSIRKTGLYSQIDILQNNTKIT